MGTCELHDRPEPQAPFLSPGGVPVGHKLPTTDCAFHNVTTNRLHILVFANSSAANQVRSSLVHVQPENCFAYWCAWPVAGGQDQSSVAEPAPQTSYQSGRDLPALVAPHASSWVASLATKPATACPNMRWRGQPKVSELRGKGLGEETAPCLVCIAIKRLHFEQRDTFVKPSNHLINHH